ncbi:S9 family peptidase [Membranihabitans marinus]|uniref:S9 family peptidase n=1 Tax=Membranihabitans marinus TaxID=1227546 RepID=UPI001F02A493|nr:prolyl oligopeptidase family serine peptidase [Membranihabitans marinus]
MELADAPLPPAIRIDSKAKYLVMLDRKNYKELSELMEVEMKLAGLRIHPKLNMSSRESYFTGIQIKNLESKTTHQVTGLPSSMKIGYIRWSPDEKYLSFTLIEDEGLSLWVISIDNMEARQISSPSLNANICSPYIWSPCSRYVMALQVLPDRPSLIDKSTIKPIGPTILTSNGQKSHNRTVQDLLKDPYDAFNFETLITSQLVKIDLEGHISPWLDPNMYAGLSFSPDGQYVKVDTIQKPFSYVVPVSKFPRNSDLYSSDGNWIKNIASIPILENLAKGFMAVHPYKRSIGWKPNDGATLVFAKALDEGNPENNTEFRDEIFLWPAPFDQPAISHFKTTNRFSHILWGKNQLSLITDYWWDNRNTATYAVYPDEKGRMLSKKIIDRDFQDKYRDPGHFIMEKNHYNRSVVAGQIDELFLQGEGYSSKGQKPFIEKWNIITDKKTKLWEDDDGELLIQIAAVIDIQKGWVLIRKEGQTTFPNYYKSNIFDHEKEEAITKFNNPFESLSVIHKEIVQYTRKDGVKLHATLMLPENYDKLAHRSIPLIMWAYPNEFKDKDIAGQITSSKNQFIYPWYGSPIYWTTRGYAVLDDVSFPIIGVEDEEPNDTFIEQLVENASAAIDAMSRWPQIDPSRVVVGGHSYGAFMAANLLTWSSLFVAGIARSGAYNRSLTPFGFQSEQRNYWEAKETYHKMSPFDHVDKIKAPILLIHGEDDNNSGTFPMQSKRYFEALKSVGATTRLVLLPKESHGYQARSSILHMLWEQDEWLQKYCKP